MVQHDTPCVYNYTVFLCPPIGSLGVTCLRLLSRMWHCKLFFNYFGLVHYKLFSTTLVLSGELKSSFFVKLNHQAFWHNGKEFSNTCTFFFQQTQNEKHASNIAALFGFLCLTRDFMLLSSNVFWNLRRCHDDVKLSR